MDVRALRYFALVAEAGSIHGGARRAMVSQPAVSVAIKKLERTLGRRLLERSPQGVTPTPEGRVLLTHTYEILRLVDGLEHAGSTVLERPATFTVGLLAGPASAGELTVPILDAFRRRRPDVDLRVRELTFRDHVDAVLDGTVDVALVRSPFVHDDVVFRPLFAEPVMVVASPAHRFASRAEVSIDEVLGERPLEVVQAPRVWRRFWGLAEYRGDAHGAIPTESVALVDYSIDVLKNATISPMALSGWRLGGFGHQALRALRLVDGPPSVVGVGHRAEETRDEVLTFTETAREVSTRLVSCVPQARPVPSAP